MNDYEITLHSSSRAEITLGKGYREPYLMKLTIQTGAVYLDLTFTENELHALARKLAHTLGVTK